MTVNGVKMVFSKQKMIERLTAEGRADAITEDIIAIMDDLDGQPVSTNSWNRQVYDEPVYTCLSKSGSHFDVNENDCVYAGDFK